MHYALMGAADTNDTGDYSYTGIKDTLQKPDGYFNPA